MKQLKYLLPLNIQFFNDGEGSGNSEEGNDETKSYSEEEFQTKLQAETDRRVTSALKKAQEKWEKDFSQKLESEKKEAERLAKLSAEEREREKLKSEREEFEKERAKHQRDALELETTKILAEKKLPTQFSSFLITEVDADKVKSHIDLFEKTFQEAVQSAVEERLKGGAPKGGKSDTNGPVTWDAALKEYYKQ